MSIEQPESEIDEDLDRKADELLKVFQGNFDNVVNSIVDSSNDINYKSRLYNMLFRKRRSGHLFLTSVGNYKALLYGLALEKIKLIELSIEGTHGLDNAALLVDWVRNCNSLRYLHLESIKNEAVLCAFIQAAHANSKINNINIKDSLLTPSVIQTILDKKRYEPEKDQMRYEFHVDPCLEFRFYKNGNSAICIRNNFQLVDTCDDEVLDDALQLMHFIRNTESLESVELRNMSNERFVRELLKAATENVNITDISASEIPPIEDIIPTLLETSKSLKRLEINGITYYYCQSYGVGETIVDITCFNNDTDWIFGKILQTIAVTRLTIADYKEVLDDAPQLIDFIQTSESLESVILQYMSNERVLRELLKASAQNVNMTRISAYHVPPVKDLIPTLLETSKSLKCLEINDLIYYHCRSYGDGETSKQSVQITCFNNETDRIFGNILQTKTVNHLTIADYDEALDDAPQLIDFIRNSESLESVRLQYISNERVVRELLKAATENVNITEISAYKIPPIQDLIPMLLETSISLTRLSMCGFSLDCSELGKEAVSIYAVDNRTIPFYVQALTKRRLIELQLKFDNGLDDGSLGLDDGSLLIEWIKHSGSLKKFRCCSMRNEVVCRELLEAAVSNPNVEHLYLEGKCIRFLSIVLNQSKSFRWLELDEHNDRVSVVGIGMSQANEFPLFEEESLSRLFKGENAHAQSRAMIEKLVLHCGLYRKFENVVSCLKENGRGGTFFNTVELKLEYLSSEDCDRFVSSLPRMREVHELDIHQYSDNRCFDAKFDCFIAMRKNFCLRRLDFPNKWDEKFLGFQNDINMLCKRNETIQNWADVGYSMPKQYLYRTLSICQMYEFSQEIVFDLMKKYWCRRSDHMHEAHELTNCSSSDKIQRKRKRMET